MPLTIRLPGILRPRKRPRRGFLRNHRLQMSMSVPDVRRQVRDGTAGSLESDWGDTHQVRPLSEPHRLSLEGLNLEFSEAGLPSGGPTMDGNDQECNSSRQQLLEDVLDTKELLQSKLRHRHNGGWTQTEAEVLNSADRAEAQVQRDAYRRQLVLKQRKMSTVLKTQSPKLPVTKSQSVAGLVTPPHSEELQHRLQQLDTSIRQNERCAAESVTQIRHRRQRQLRALQELGVSADNLTSIGINSTRMNPLDSASSLVAAQGVTLRRQRPLPSPSSPRRRTPLRIISVLSKSKRSSEPPEWDIDPAIEAPSSSLRSTISEEALREIERFETLMHAYLKSENIQAVNPLAIQHFV